ncbi:nucleolin [Diachasma alloeum]|uniref:nucleolin n=1 Tax=Diachasma alloeum TaxID=454923 RepID=UPI000738477B|nr:nucleolin [Diachasma alloeum]
MRLSTVFELLLIFLLIAFAAYGRVIDRNETSLYRVARATKQNFGVSFMSLKQATENVNKYCTCNENICNCCRKFHIPLVRVQGPGCASLQYLKENNLAVQLSFGKNILTSTVISGKKPRAICVPMPGGLTKFCGRIYSIEREAQDHFKACLGLELQSASELEASLRVSCFRFGPDGLQLRPAESLPVIDPPKPDAEDDDDDDYDIFGLDDETESDENPPAKNPQAPESSDDDDDDDDDDDVLGFGALLDIFTGDDDSSKKKTTTAAPLLPFTIPLITKPSPTVSSPPQPMKLTKPTEEIPLEMKNPTKIPQVLSTAPPESAEVVEEMTDQTVKDETTEVSEDAAVPEEAVTGEQSGDVEESTSGPAPEVKPLEEKPLEPSDPTTSPEVAATVLTPAKTGVKKLVGIKTVKKPSLTANSPNAIVSDAKPLSRPTKPDPTENSDEDEEDYILASDSDEEDDETENTAEESEAEDDEEDEGENESEEEEDAALAALVSDDSENTKDEKVSDNETSKPEEDDADYGMGLAELLARKQSSRRQWSGRQSKVMRL